MACLGFNSFGSEMKGKKRSQKVVYSVGEQNWLYNPGISLKSAHHNAHSGNYLPIIFFTHL